MGHEVTARNRQFSASIDCVRERWRGLPADLAATVSREGEEALVCHGSRDIADLHGVLDNADAAIRMFAVRAASFEKGRFTVEPVKVQRHGDNGGAGGVDYTARLSFDGQAGLEYSRRESQCLRELLADVQSFVVARECGLSHKAALHELGFRHERHHDREQGR